MQQKREPWQVSTAHWKDEILTCWKVMWDGQATGPHDHIPLEQAGRLDPVFLHIPDSSWIWYVCPELCVGPGSPLPASSCVLVGEALLFEFDSWILQCKT